MITHYNKRTRALTFIKDGKLVAGLVGRRAAEMSENIFKSTTQIVMNTPELKRKLEAKLADLNQRVKAIKPETIADIRQINNIEVRIASVRSRLHMLNYSGDVSEMPVYSMPKGYGN